MTNMICANHNVRFRVHDPLKLDKYYYVLNMYKYMHKRAFSENICISWTDL